MKLEKSPKKKNKFIRFFRLAYLKVFRTNDSPHKVSFGVAIGVFSGILPGTGPIAALFMASFLKANRASALLGSLLTNTWISLTIPVISIKIGALVTGLKWHELYNSWAHIRMTDIFKLPILQVLLPVMLGYLVVAFAVALVTYVVTLIMLRWIKPAIKKWRKTVQK
ncbi:MAG: DUF2062 domain-containing protein [Candidatus Omnitrophota bacterium]